MGRVVAPYGIKGWIKILPFSAEPDALATYARWWLGKNGEWREVEVVAHAQHGRHLTAQIAGFQNPEQAVTLKGSEIAVPRAALPASDQNEFYLADLIGLDVVNMRGEPLGKVAELLDNGAHSVLRLAHEDKQRLLPFVAAVVKQVDLAGGVIRVEWELDW